MKKILLFFGIAAFMSASAQQNDLFDIQKHLLKKSADNNNLVKKKNIDLPLINNPLYINNNPVDSYTLSNGDKVVISRLDNMPCVQPDMQQFQRMPNIAYQEKFNFSTQQLLPGQIPNGSKPFSLIVHR